MDNPSILVGYTKPDSDNTERIITSLVTLDLKRANRHGLIAGATGTGKTVTLQALAESFSSQGVPVFLVDVKGDVSGVSQAGKPHPKINERFSILGLPQNIWKGCPTIFWDLYGQQGHPIRATISDMGPLLLARLLSLNETQQGMLDVAFAVADDQGLLLLDLKDLRSILQYISGHASELRNVYGNVSSTSVGAIQRRLLSLERSGAKAFFGEPMLDIADLMKVDDNGTGYINVLSANKLVQEPTVYSTLLLWLLSELFEELPEIGDPEKPKLVLFFDEAHLMFKDTPKALVEKVEQVVRLIRSKGVGVYFITQSPGDIPDTVLAQLANRFQHALRAYTPKEQKVVKVAADTFRSDGSFSVRDAICEMGVGEALVSTLLRDGSPSFVQRTFIKPPISRIGPASSYECDQVRAVSPCLGKYDATLDRKSAFEKLAERAEQVTDEANQKILSKKRTYQPQKPRPKSKGRQRQGILETFAKSVVRSLGSRAGRSLVRGVLGSLFKGR
jgi:DNA double-strand break repair helicase HerA and related ATPase